MVYKTVRDGKVAVLVSPGFGAGWSTWASNAPADFMCMDRELVRLARRSAPNWEVEKYIRVKGFDEDTGGWKGIEVAWLPVGTRFTIEEYGGSESIRTVDDLVMVA